VKLPPFAIHRPASVSEASRMLTDLGDHAAAYCGGTELLLAMKLGLTAYDHLVDLKRVAGLRGIQRSNGSVRVGAATTHQELESSAQIRASYPELSAMIAQIANLRVRSVGTLGGNLCFADPHSDPASFLTAINATLVCQKGGDTRQIPAAGFLAGPYETILVPGELLVAVDLPARPESTGLAHLRMKLTERPVVTVTASITLTDGVVSAARVVIGSAASTPVVAADAAQSLLGASSADIGDRADACADQASACATPTADGEASADYVRHLIRLHSRQAVRQAFASAQASG
jgi:aerobic carbon-monoxide dehydrogenase medium subunit